MKAHSDTRPEPIQHIGDGCYYVNMNIHEVKQEMPSRMGEGENEEPKTHISYEYDYVKSAGYPTYGGTVTSLIRERYTESDELAIQRQRDSKPATFAEYNEFCEACKDKARPVFFPEEHTEGILEQNTQEESSEQESPVVVPEENTLGNA